MPWALATPWVMRLAVRAPMRLRWPYGSSGVASALRGCGLHAANWFVTSVGASLWVAVTEHLLNPWNPGTRLVMRRIPFDRDAKLLSPPHARELLTRAGFNVLRTDFLFLFPRVLSALRPPEGRLARFPVGAQYMVLCRKGKW